MKHQLKTPDYGALVEKLGAGLEIPVGSLPGGFHIELENNSCALIDGCAGVLQYCDCSVKLNLGRMILKIYGENLTITAMQDSRASVAGDILGLEFTN